MVNIIEAVVDLEFSKRGGGSTELNDMAAQQVKRCGSYAHKYSAHTSQYVPSCERNRLRLCLLN